MRGPDRVDLTIAVGAVVGSAIVAVMLQLGVAEWIFFGVLTVGVGALVRALGRAWRMQREVRRSASVIKAMDPEALSAQAVRQERAALFDDISLSLFHYLERVHELAGARAGRGPETARHIHRESQAASSELRRQLGLLRKPDTPAKARPTATPMRKAESLSVGDLTVGALAGMLGLVEALAYQSAEGMVRSPVAVVLTAVAAFTLTWRRVAPARAAVAAGFLFVAGAALDGGLIAGFWMMVTLGGLVWQTIAPPTRDWLQASAGLGLIVVAGASTSLTDPANAGVTWVALLAVFAAAVATRLVREAGERARRQGVAHVNMISDAQRAAVDAERRTIARELHDVVSHAVGLIAMQSAAANVTWEREPDAAERAFMTIESTARTTLAELSRFQSTSPESPRSTREFDDLIARVQAAGTPVAASGLNDVPIELRDITYRILQECLTNTLRHARGARATVTLLRDDGLLHIRVQDDGPGAALDASRGYGLVGLRERVQLAGGSFALSSPPAGGLIIDVTLPDREVAG